MTPWTPQARRIAAVFALCTLGAGGVVPPAKADVLLHLDGNVLTGASGVVVNGAAYDVSFLDGSCSSLQLGCTQFTFSTAGDAQAAAQALLDQVFLAAFDTSPQWTRGCTATSQCLVSTLFAADGDNLASTTNAAVELDDRVTVGTLGAQFNTAAVPSVTMALWSVAPNRVPEPATLALALAGLGLIWSLRRQARR